MRIDRPIGSLLLLWPTLWALWIAGEGRPLPWIVAVFVTGVFVMRSAGCVVNDYADRHVDPHVERTRGRPLAAGDVSEREAIMLFVALCLVAFGLVLSLNGLAVLLSGIGAVLAATYPFVKRVTHLPQLYLGVAFGWGIPMAFAAQSGRVPWLAWLLLAANITWVMAYDTLYAMVDRDDDLRVGVKSSAILFEQRDRHWIAAFHAGTLLLLGIVGYVRGLNAYYYAGLAAAAGFASYQHLLYRSRQRDRCFAAFVNNSWFGAAVFGGIVLAYL